ncbi:hypothetical protein [Aquisalimonas asiatica]|uniref:Dihydroorotate dehydrogenase electron transfer subunit n=1 Tax=Aquisalimonas asiatica TaxID=406100 RepID=A0A1H8TPP8_9GAMM|nr:hypothetical protein [Aquisalimonas asiatica]SEO92847.1 dihydroorotate dehydrogenase electron transfer subunit [Aquisalimonas asiatica]
MTAILANTALPGGGRLLRLDSDCAGQARPGHWFRLTVAGQEHRLAVLDASPREGWLAFQAPAALADVTRGAPCDSDGPHGSPLPDPAGERQQVVVSDETGLPAVLFAAARGEPVALALIALESEIPDVRLRPSRFVLEGFEAGAIAGVGALEDAGIPSRVAHPTPLPGCQEGVLASLVDTWLSTRSAHERWQMAVTVIGSTARVHELTALLRGRVGEHHTCPLPA